MTDPAVSSGRALTRFFAASWREGATSAAAGLRYVVVDRALASALETTHSELFEAAARTTRHGPEQFTRDLPKVGEDALAHLDERGIAKVGSLVKPGSLLVGCVAPTRVVQLSSEEKLLRSIFGEAAVDVIDTSLRVPPGVVGMVTLARREAIGPAERGRREVDRATVQVSWVHALRPGDALVDDRGRRVLVRGIDDDTADLRLAEGEPAVGPGAVRIAKADVAADVLHGRSIGPYAPTTQRPREGKASFGGQPVSRGLIAALVRERHAWTAFELLALKCDGIDARLSTYESIVKGTYPSPATDPMLPLAPAPTDGVTRTETVSSLVSELFALGFAAEVGRTGVAGAWATSEQLRAHSHGAVTLPEWFDAAGEAVPSGLKCQRIFGPIKDYACACGKHTRMRDRGLVCDVCGVEVIQSRSRRERFGHIELPALVPHPWRLGEIARALGLTVDEIRTVARCEADLVDGRLGPPRRLGDTGGPALARALATSATAGALVDVIPVLPADLRPITLREPDGRVYSDANELYAQLVERVTFATRRVSQGTSDASLRGDLGRVFTAVETLFANLGGAGVPPVGDRGVRLHALADRVARHAGAQLVERTVDYSGVARLVADPTLPSGTCRLPRALAHELFKPWAYGLMEERGFVTTIKAAKLALEKRAPFALQAVDDVAGLWPVLLATETFAVFRRVEVWDAPAIAVHPGTAVALASEEVRVHVPLGQRAVESARAAIAHPIAIGARARDTTAPSGWLSEIAAGGDVAGVLGAIGPARAHDPVADPVLRIGLGLWPDEPPAPTSWVREAPAGERHRADEAAAAAWRARPVGDLTLSVRTFAALEAAGLTTVGELLALGDAELLKRKIGRRTLKEIDDALAAEGLRRA